jgi:hypothetical protein
MTQFTCKGVKQINNRISFKHLYHSYLSAFFISARVPNGEFPEILIAKRRSRFIVLDFFVGGKKRCVREINVSCAWDPVHAGDKALTRETTAKRGRVNRYGYVRRQHSYNICRLSFPSLLNEKSKFHQQLHHKHELEHLYNWKQHFLRNQ